MTTPFTANPDRCKLSPLVPKTAVITSQWQLVSARTGARRRHGRSISPVVGPSENERPARRVCVASAGSPVLALYMKRGVPYYSNWCFAPIPCPLCGRAPYCQPSPRRSCRGLFVFRRLDCRAAARNTKILRGVCGPDPANALLAPQSPGADLRSGCLITERARCQFRSGLSSPD
jgi:hypothetical protein